MLVTLVTGFSSIFAYSSALGDVAELLWQRELVHDPGPILLLLDQVVS
jgi:hypothetical protein